ncbi:hypothetical protein Acr_00g0077840 [Actinidia rufa]|uniref:Uncharacterized protein n=1 Tax=Actinidia rufa TaxID=165716 RepID=A0A7J0DTN9_9ERIC|nr:hypothetical protein Acr_00g0077840 [Actinidia rufa]
MVALLTTNPIVALAASSWRWGRAHLRPRSLANERGRNHRNPSKKSKKKAGGMSLAFLPSSSADAELWKLDFSTIELSKQSLQRTATISEHEDQLAELKVQEEDQLKEDLAAAKQAELPAIQLGPRLKMLLLLIRADGLRVLPPGPFTARWARGSGKFCFCSTEVGFPFKATNSPVADKQSIVVLLVSAIADFSLVRKCYYEAFTL